jgi:colicin import membrane protein
MTGDSLHYSVPRPPGRWESIVLAVAVHAALFGFLWVGINWVSQKPETMDAEVWSAQDLAQAPPPPPPVVEPEPVVKDVPPPVEKAPAEDPEIKLEQIRKQKRLEQDRVEQEKRQREINAAKKIQAAQEQAKLDEAKKKADDDKRKLQAEAQKKQELEAKQLAKIKADEKARITGEATSTSSAGTAAKSQGNSSNGAWIARVTAKVKSNILGVAIPPDAANNPAEFEVGLLPDGSVAGIRQTKKSGIPAFDDAVRRAIEASQPYPADASGRVPSSFTSTNRPRDQQP